MFSYKRNLATVARNGNVTVAGENEGIQPRRERSHMDTQVDCGLAASAQVMVVDADHALFELIAEWFASAGHRVVAESGAGEPASGRPDVIVVDIPFPRQGGIDVLRRVGLEHPGVPVLALSSTFFGGIGSNGAIASMLGVAGVLPKPVKEDALVTAVRRLLNSPK
jgi:CheY-like chemotaxis protein